MVYLEPGGYGVYANGNSNTSVVYDLLLRDATDTNTLSQVASQTYMNWANGLAGAPLPTGAIMPKADGSPYVAAAGTYVAKLTAFVSGSCTPTNLTTFGATQLSIAEIGNGS
jgi:hypothetical protein